jgi:ubiquinone/menaquinone biosynthesis C-methylase UbiE
LIAACSSEQLKTQIKVLCEEYYTDYYCKQLGLPDWESRVKRRMVEDENIEVHIAMFESVANERIDAGKKVLVVGGGTGADYMAFVKRGCEVHAVEPNDFALKIARLKAQMSGTDQDRFIKGEGENLPYSDNCFDIVWCFTVLEHVQDVTACIADMIRVTKVSGRIFIVTPDYRQFYEPHYKLAIPMFLPKCLIRILLHLAGRPTRFMDSLQFITSKQLRNIFQDSPVTAIQIIQHWPVSWRNKLTVSMKIIKFITKHLGIQRDQYWILIKSCRIRD